MNKNDQWADLRARATELLQVLGSLVQLLERYIRNGVEGIKKRAPALTQELRKHWKNLQMLTVLAMTLPLPILLFGFMPWSGSDWLILAVALFWFLCTILAAVLAIPLGLLIEMLLGGWEGSGRRYVQLIAWIFLAELTFALLVSALPVHRNPTAFIWAMAAALGLGILGALGERTRLGRKLLWTTLFMILVLSLISIVLPEGTVLWVKRGFTAITPRDAFNTKTGDAQLMVEELPGGRLEIYPIGTKFSPKTGKPLAEVTAKHLEKLAQQKRLEELERRATTGDRERVKSIKLTPQRPVMVVQLGPGEFSSLFSADDAVMGTQNLSDCVWLILNSRIRVYDCPGREIDLDRALGGPRRLLTLQLQALRDSKHFRGEVYAKF